MHMLIQMLWNARFPGKVRLLSPLVPKQGTRTGRVFGARVELDLADYVQRMMYLGTFEREETSHVLRYLRPGMTFVDVGANAGYFTYLAARAVGDRGRVLAVEPDHELFAKLERSVRANALRNVTALNIGLGRTIGILNLSIPPPEHANRAPTLAPVAGWSRAEVSIRRLDDVLDQLNMPVVDLLKIDVEGFEAEVFAGAERALRGKKVRAVLCEFNDYWLREHGSSPDQLYDLIRDFGFRGAATRPSLARGSVVNEFFTLA